MKPILILLAVLTSFSLVGFAAPVASTSVNRTELFKMVDDSLFFIISDALTDNTFLTTTSLTDKELQMLAAIVMVLNESRNLRYFQEKQITPYLTLFKNYQYIFLDSDNVKNVFETPFVKGPELVFSTDQSLFKLNPNEPIRTAMTFPEFEGDIYINLNLINSPSVEFDFPSVVSLLTHEYGHKITSNKDQAAIDSAAARMAKFIKNKISKVSVGNQANVYFLKYGFFSPVVKWMQAVMDGTNISWYMNISQLLSNHTDLALINYDRQGFYLWSEDAIQIKDLRSLVFSKVETENIIKFPTQAGIIYARHNLFLSENIQVTKKGDSIFNLAWTGIFFHEIIPYLNSSVLAATDLVDVSGTSWKNTGPVGQIPLQVNLDIDLKNLTSSNTYNIDSNVKYFLPNIDGELVNFNKGEDLTFDVKFNNALVYIYTTEAGRKAQLWPTALIKTSYGAFQVSAFAGDPVTNVYRFKIKNTKDLLLGKIVVNQFLLKTNYWGLVDTDSFILGQIYLKKPVSIDLGVVSSVASASMVKLGQFEQLSQVIRFQLPALKNISAINLTLKYGMDFFYRKTLEAEWGLVTQVTHVKSLWVGDAHLSVLNDGSTTLIGFDLKNLLINEESILEPAGNKVYQKKQTAGEAEVIELTVFDSALNKYEVKLEKPIKIKL